MNDRNKGGRSDRELDFTIPNHGRKRRRAFAEPAAGVSVPDSKKLDDKRFSEAKNQKVSGLSPETHVSSDPSTGRARLGLISLCASVGVVLVAVYIINDAFEAESSFDDFKGRVCDEFKSLASPNAESRPPAFALFAAACGSSPKGR